MFYIYLFVRQSNAFYSRFTSLAQIFIYYVQMDDLHVWIYKSNDFSPSIFPSQDCRQPFQNGSFFDHEGLPYCETHYHAKRGSLCAGCSKPITGRCITAMFRKFHPEHFVCAFCLKQLNKGTFKEQNDKPYCHDCFDKLFGWSRAHKISNTTTHTNTSITPHTNNNNGQLKENHHFINRINKRGRISVRHEYIS